MIQWQKWPWRVGWSMVLILMVPGLALAHNCSSLSDCWGTVLGGLATAMGVGGVLAGSLPSGNGGGPPDTSLPPPQGGDPSDDPCYK